MPNWGLVYKPKWRPVGATWHCFVSADYRRGYTSLCGEHSLRKAGGGRCRRPPPIRRCARCDVGEMRLYRVEESRPESPDWAGG